MRGYLLAAGCSALAAWLLNISPDGIVSHLVALAGVVILAGLTFWYGLPVGITGVAVLVGVLVAWGPHPYLAPYWGVRVGGAGVVYGYALGSGLAAGQVVALGLGIMLVAVLVALPFFTSLWATWRAALLASVEPAWEMYRQSGLLDTLTEMGGTAESFRQALERTAGMIATLVPSFTILELACWALAGYLLVYWLARHSTSDVRKARLGVECQGAEGKPGPAPIPAFSKWRVPWYLSWIIIGGLGMALLGDYSSLNKLVEWGANTVFLYLVLAAVIGLAVGASYYLYLPWPPLIKNILLLPIILYPPFTFFALLVVTVVGLFDPLIDFRRWVKERG